MKSQILFVVFIVKLYSSAAQPVIKSILRLPDTGQKNSYTTTFGEDNDYTINPPGFIKHQNGTVTDTVTGLMWQISDGGEMTIENARKYCDTLTQGGYNDWRLPLPLEAFSLLNHQNNNPALDITFFTKNTAEYWWTSVTQFKDSNKVWCTNAGGGIGNHPKLETISAGGTKKFHVRAVRNVTSPATIPNRYSDLGNGSIQDHLTNLIWQKNPVSTSMTWENALVYAESLNLAGDTNWRLPNIKELYSLHDPSSSGPAVNGTFFNQLGIKKFWSSSSLPNQTTKAWYWETQFGITTYDLKTNSNYVICVSNPSNNKTSTPALNFAKNLSVSPNPFKNYIKINGLLIEEHAQLYNHLGVLIYEGTHIEQQDFTNLSQGIYFLKYKNCLLKIAKE